MVGRLIELLELENELVEVLVTDTLTKLLGVFVAEVTVEVNVELTGG